MATLSWRKAFGAGRTVYPEKPSVFGNRIVACPQALLHLKSEQTSTLGFPFAPQHLPLLRSVLRFFRPSCHWGHCPRRPRPCGPH